MKLVCVSVDLDEVSCYHSIHGIEDPPPENAARSVYTKALERFRSLFDRRGIKSTLFVVGREIGRIRQTDDLLMALHEDGHELANHTLNHRYNLIQLGSDIIREEIEACAERIEILTGTGTAGFRAPGYSITDELLDLLEDQNYLYDSSVFPCPLYYLAKAAVMGGLYVTGRSSRSILTGPGVLRAPGNPYRTGRPYWKGGNGIREFPIGVSGPMRLPFIGTSILMAGDWLFRFMAESIMSRDFVNIELHGIDLADARADGLEYLAGHQPDLRLSLEYKMQRFERTIDIFRDNGFEFVTLKQAVSRMKF